MRSCHSGDLAVRDSAGSETRAERIETRAARAETRRARKTSEDETGSFESSGGFGHQCVLSFFVLGFVCH
jgi:hypothetical protein